MTDRYDFSGRSRPARAATARTALALLVLTAALSPAAAQESAAGQVALEARIKALEQELASLKQAVQEQQVQQVQSVDNARLDELDQKVRVVARKQDIADEEAAAKAKITPVVTASEKGFSIASNDGAFLVRFRSLVQADGRFYVDNSNSDTFLMRRARLELTGTLFKQFEFRLMEDFAGSSPTLLDAWVDWKISPQFQLLAGKSKMPVALEREQSREWNLMNEFGYPTTLAPNRTVGLAVHGSVWDTNLDYYLGAYNWAPDGATSTLSASGDANLVGRLFARPFSQQIDKKALRGLGFGIAGTQGNGGGTPSNYNTVGQLPFYRWRTGVVVDGETWRVIPQAYYYNGPFGLTSEYAISSQTVRLGGVEDKVKNKGWEVTGSWVLTGEEATFKGVKPLKNFGFGPDGGWGAWQVVLRATELNIDDDAFPVFADPVTSASAATSYGIGLNGYLNPIFRFSADYNHTDFSGANTLEVENSIITRLQMRY